MDPGLQPQRTALAWNRTAFATLVNALVVLRAGVQEVRPAALGLGVLLLAAAGLLVAFGAWRARKLATGSAPGAPPWVFIAGTTLIVWTASIAALTVVWQS